MVRDDDFTRAIVSALRGMDDYGPEPLLDEVSHKLQRRGLSITEGELVEILTDPNLNARERNEFHHAVSRWDAALEANWADATGPSTLERRAVVLDRLGFGDDATNSINDAFPPYLTTDVAIVAPNWEPWYPAQGGHPFYWPAYRNVLQGNGYPPEAIASIDATTDNIVSRLAHPVADAPYQSKGLVVGHVQSGKTANFTGVLAKAIDAGYRLVIILTGTVELLRAQTQRRLDMELIGKENILGGRNPEDPGAILDTDYVGDGDLDWLNGKFVQHDVNFGMADSIPAIRRLTGRDVDYKRLAAGLDALDFRSGNELRNPRQPVWHPDNLFGTDVRIAVVKKNKAVLTKLVQDLRNVRARLDEIPALIIDDEADQASVNTKKNTDHKTAEEIERTAINKLIAQLLGELRRCQYVGYTATPFANVFVSPEDAEDIFPKDFIVSLTPPEAYMGARDFHDLDGLPEDAKSDPGRSNEAAFVRDLVADDDVGVAAELQSALDAFVLSGAVKLWREQRDPKLGFQHHTMLVHESVKQAEHRELAALIRKVWAQAAYTSPKAAARLRDLFVNDAVRVTTSRSEWHGDASLPTDFDELQPFIGRAVDLIMITGDPVVVVNGDKDADYEQVDFQKAKTWRILVGGTKLSRGFTVEGLTITYYRRKARQADSLMQMGRWFGYRPNYRDLVRLFIARNAEGPRRTTIDLYEAFQAIVEDEEDFRDQLRKFAELTDDGEPAVKPIDVPPLVFQQLPWLKPTSPNKMYNAELAFIGEGGKIKDFPRQADRGDGSANTAHFSAVEPWLARLGSQGTFEYRDGTSRGTFQARTLIVGADEMQEILRRFRWTDGYSFEPTLSMITQAMSEGTLQDWAVMLPYLTKNPTLKRVNGYEIPILRRRRRQDREGFSGSSFRQRDAAEHIAGSPERHGGSEAEALSTATRGSMLLTFAADPKPGADRDPHLLPDDGQAKDVATLFSLALPYNSAPRGRIGFRVKDRQRPTAAVVDRNH